ncbi:hypothetical protein HSR121_0691 [Halapricum desulfuricans]|uniref:Uncharacterized protein n=1 Tax=Halapricum desulfuricans TaxID=2841257 RepID=A0A897N2U2_9EURY|nr:hypothetical protein HSR121_0691 [Halapricum desulfuricans]
MSRMTVYRHYPGPVRNICRLLFCQSYNIIYVFSLNVLSAATDMKPKSES